MRKISVMVALVVLISVIGIVIRPGDRIDAFLQRRISGALHEEYPAYAVRFARMHYEILHNRLECDSVTLVKCDSSFSCTVSRFTVSDIGRMRLFAGEGIAPSNLISSTFSADELVMTFPRSGYEICCDRLHVSVPDSVVVVDGIDLHTVGSDRHYFAASKFRQTRYHLVVPHCTVIGSGCLGIINGQIRCAHKALIENPFLDVLINNEKNSDSSAQPPRMPNEILSSIGKTIQLDSLCITGGRFTYGATYAAGSNPARFSVDQIEVAAEGWSRPYHHEDTVIITATGRLMEAGFINLHMLIPVASQGCNFLYSGSLTGMDACALNPWLEVAEGKRFKTGSLESASFNIHVVGGTAKGVVHAAYKDLKIVSFNRRTGSESGIVDMLVSFISNNIKLRTTNLPDDDGSIKSGEVNYTRKRDDAFFTFAWLSIRSGLGDVIGF